MTTATKAKKKSAAISSEDFEHDAIMLRTSAGDGTSYGGFQWPKEVGAVVTCPDWNQEAVCGGGLHGLLDGFGNRALLNTAEGNRLWWIVGVKRSECVVIDNEKVKVPRAKVIYFGDFAGALTRTTQPSLDAILSAAKSATGHLAEGEKENAAATGDSGHAAATGKYGHAAATGYSGHAAATGDNGHAAATGEDAIAAALGVAGQAKAGADGWLVLAAYGDYDYTADRRPLLLVKAAKVGTEGIEADTFYRLTPAGEFVKAE